MVEFVPAISDKNKESIKNSIARIIEEKTKGKNMAKNERKELINKLVSSLANITTEDQEGHILQRKKIGNTYKGVDGVLAGKSVKILKGEFLKDPKDKKEKLFLYCEIKNEDTLSGGKKGVDTGWISASYLTLAEEKTQTAKNNIEKGAGSTIIKSGGEDGDENIGRDAKINTPPSIGVSINQPLRNWDNTGKPSEMWRKYINEKTFRDYEKGNLEEQKKLTKNILTEKGIKISARLEENFPSSVVQIMPDNRICMKLGKNIITLTPQNNGKYEINSYGLGRVMFDSEKNELDYAE